MALRFHPLSLGQGQAPIARRLINEGSKEVYGVLQLKYSRLSFIFRLQSTLHSTDFGLFLSILTCIYNVGLYWIIIRFKDINFWY